MREGKASQVLGRCGTWRFFSRPANVAGGLRIRLGTESHLALHDGDLPWIREFTSDVCRPSFLLCRMDAPSIAAVTREIAIPGCTTSPRLPNSPGKTMSGTPSTPRSSTAVTSSAAVAYLLALRRLGAATSPVGTGQLAAELNVRPPSVVTALRRLGRDRLVRVSPHRGSMLTPSGGELARNLYRRHALAEVLLHRVLNLEWDELHAEAVRLQAALSPRLEAALTERFVDASETPYGQPIPPTDREQPGRDLVCLSELESGCGMTVCEVDDLDAERLREYQRAGLIPGATVRVLTREQCSTLRVRVGKRESELGHQSATGVLGEPTTNSSTDLESVGGAPSSAPSPASAPS